MSLLSPLNKHPVYLIYGIADRHYASSSDRMLLGYTSSWNSSYENNILFRDDILITKGERVKAYSVVSFDIDKNLPRSCIYSPSLDNISKALKYLNVKCTLDDNKIQWFLATYNENVDFSNVINRSEHGEYALQCRTGFYIVIM